MNFSIYTIWSFIKSTKSSFSCNITIGSFMRKLLPSISLNCTLEPIYLALCTIYSNEIRKITFKYDLILFLSIRSSFTTNVNVSCKYHAMNSWSNFFDSRHSSNYLSELYLAHSYSCLLNPLIYLIDKVLIRHFPIFY